jgi:mannose-6-phosphate isomerase-like protein (cupin superfamily)
MRQIAMRQLAVFISAVGILLAGLLAVGPVSIGQAQQSTPTASGSTGVTSEVLGRFPSELAPGQALALLRITVAPGGSVAPHTHPGETVYHLSAGTLQFTMLEGEAQLVRAVDGVPAAATPTAGEALPVGEEITLNAGDTIYYDATVLQSERNDGTEDAVVLVANLRGVDEPARQFHDAMAAGTPAA